MQVKIDDDEALNITVKVLLSTFDEGIVLLNSYSVHENKREMIKRALTCITVVLEYLNTADKPSYYLNKDL